MSLSSEDSSLDEGRTLRDLRGGATVFQRYRLERLLGRGGMGMVWLARDRKLEESALALKFLPPELVHDDVAVHDLRKETLRCRDLRHPHIVSVYGFEHDADSAAIAMEFIDGKNLSQLRLNKPHEVWEVAELAPLLGQLCSALEYAHEEAERRLVHRDLKPSNLMLNAQGKLKIMDFGIATSISESLSRRSARSAEPTGGSPAYMSPQQWNCDPVSVADDVYSLGATVYELLTGKPPFFGGHLRDAVMSRKAPPMRQRRQELGVGSVEAIPAAWEAVVAACLEKERTKRPVSVAEVWRRLQVKPLPVVRVLHSAKGPGRPSCGSSSSSPSPASSARAPAPASSLPQQKASPRDESFTNSLGMKFVRVPDTQVMFCIYLTRKQDYRQYAEQAAPVDGSWEHVEYEGVPVSEGEDHPVVMVSWDDAQAFCQWLSHKEGCTYRLPTDHEWSCAVGIGQREKASDSPQRKNKQIPDVYPWGTEWPPPPGAGNFADESAKRKFADWPIIDGYDDGYATTSPVMTFKPNNLGLYDMAGNVWEWCDDWYDSEEKYRVLRGGSWFLSDPDHLLSSFRSGSDPASRSGSIGFRVVVVR